MKSQTFVTSWIAAAVLALGSSVAVQAQVPATGQESAQPSATSPSKGPRGEHRQRMDPAQRAAKRAEMQAKREADFKQKLNLTAAQQGAWTQYTAAMKSAHPAPTPAERDARKAEREALAKMSTPQRIDAMKKRHAEMAGHMKARGEATKAFYAQLSPAQQKTFDAETARRFEHRGPRGEHGHGHGPRGEGGDHGKHGRHGQPGSDGKAQPKAVPAAPTAPAAPTK